MKAQYLQGHFTGTLYIYTMGEIPEILYKKIMSQAVLVKIRNMKTQNSPLAFLIDSGHVLRGHRRLLTLRRPTDKKAASMATT